MTDILFVYTDGACSPNPGHAGIGIFMEYKNQTKEVSEYIGETTNNVAELTAIKRALSLIKNKSKHIIIYTDSQYCVGVLTKFWNAKKNEELILDIRENLLDFENLKIKWIKSHSGNKGNEIADKLAVKAKERRM